ncbi:zinc finger protein 62 homolog [Ceratina calcarata]|uniref:Zinc finger protein 62 homolog n=1 Tax=Ceratina calcarata TaxID=156304 RepID=A0AAJ7J0R3_9HYME|nr:zinc finger protein 62 homolog [Ceratina calcarata]XP_017881289.1 zinc finger protein 62 homolog [Ceratina calcarata]
MLTLEDPECKDFSKKTMEDEETNEKGNSGEDYESTKFPTVNGEILRTVLLSAGDDDDVVPQGDDISSELLSIDNDSEITSESTVSDWDDLRNDSTFDSYDTSVPNNKEYLLITQLESDNQLLSKKLNDERPLTENKSKSKHCSKRRNKVSLLRKLIPKHEPIVEIKEEESIISTDVEERVPTMEEYEEPSMEQQNLEDSKDNVAWLQNLTPLPLYYTEKGKPYLKCPACGAMFFTSNSFQKHLYSHVYKEDDTFVCNFCNYTNTEPGMLFSHLSKHQDQCEFCNENLMRKNNFERHWNIRASNFTMKRDRRGRFVCTLCKLVFDLLPQLEKHWLKHACRRERNYQCKECSGLYDSRETLNNHKCMKCPVCGKIYDSLQRLKAHTMWTKHNLKCPICSYEFILTMDHEKHLALHRQTFSSMTDYEHCLQAADGKTFQCNLCDKIFYAVPTLVLHLQEDHGIENVKKEVLKDGEQKEESISDIILREYIKNSSANFSTRSNNLTLTNNKVGLQNAL